MRWRAKLGLKRGAKRRANWAGPDVDATLQVTGGVPPAASVRRETRWADPNTVAKRAIAPRRGGARGGRAPGLSPLRRRAGGRGGGRRRGGARGRRGAVAGAVGGDAAAAGGGAGGVRGDAARRPAGGDAGV